jgi:hypothetical protein
MTTNTPRRRGPQARLAKRRDPTGVGLIIECAETASGASCAD